MLRSPAVKVPYSLTGQLEYIRDRWAELLGVFLQRLLGSLDLIREEETAAARAGFMGGPGPVMVPVYDQMARELEAENFSPDREWMPRLVLIAKNTYVWLDQLSDAYGRKINRLDEIPEEELQKMASWGFSGLWLIGLWERSKASAQIKQVMGNPEAIASAYSLYDYRIAEDLGGEDAYQGLRAKAWRCGIRLASDMVPNHMGIDSPWVADHPDWFLSLDYSPYPSYSFTGPNFSSDSRVSIYIEDHYFTRTDAAVVFKLVDHRDGKDYYIYHGNDGTSMPWNDTAQLNYLKGAVREAVIQTILAVARRFPIIRFDAAMTLAKMHYERLWFPPPGMGGAIPSRSEHGMTKEEFDALMPMEFWREVVERVQQEVPDTLLLAEAFWLMEGYFVRTLGMHRVYNSAFMNSLRNEENGKYRQLMKNTLEFDPEILKRYVNFMNNPDERTAVDQFGKGDKYFGVATLLATMPGLPMFGHGQVEGFSEKYGMEFRRAYWDEKPDLDLIERHKHEIFPLLHRRGLFAGVENFLLYDFFTPEGQVNEDVFAYSNGQGSERALVVYHNTFGDTRGWVRTSVGYSVKEPGGERMIIQRNLSEGLNLRADPRVFCIYRDISSELEFIRPSMDMVEKGMYLSLGAYEHHVFVDFREIKDDDWNSYRRLYEYLGGRGVPSIQATLQELLLQPVLQPFREIANPGYFRFLTDARLVEPSALLPKGLLDEAARKQSDLLAGIERMIGSAQRQAAILRDLRSGLRLALSLPVIESRFSFYSGKKVQQAVTYLLDGLKAHEGDASWAVVWGWMFLHDLGRLNRIEGFEDQAVSWIDEWRLGAAFKDAVRGLGIDQGAADEALDLLKVLVSQQNWYIRSAHKNAGEILKEWLADAAIQRYLGVNRYNERLWFNHERFIRFIWWMNLLVLFQSMTGEKAGTSLMVEGMLRVQEMVRQWLAAEEVSGFEVKKLIQSFETDPQEK